MEHCKTKTQWLTKKQTFIIIIKNMSKEFCSNYKEWKEKLREDSKKIF